MTSTIPVAVLTSANSPVEAMVTRLAEKVASVEVSLWARSWNDIAETATHPAFLVILDAEFDEFDTAEQVKELRAIGSRVIVVRGSDAPKEVLRDMAAGAEASMLLSKSSRRLASQVRLSAGRAALIAQRSADLSDDSRARPF